MKKFLIIAAMATMSMSAFAQYTPEKGDFATEISFTPFQSSGEMFSLKDNASLQFRYFLDSKNALRLRLGFGVNNKKDTETGVDVGGSYSETPSEGQTYSTDEYKNVTKNKQSSFTLNLGYERHFKAMDRLDLYVGAELGIYTISRRATVTAEGTKTGYVAEKASSTSDPEWNVAYTTTYEGKREYKGMNASSVCSAFGFNADIFTGLDFYVYKKLYVGVELGLGVDTGKNPKKGYYTEESASVTSYAINGGTSIATANKTYSSETGRTTTTTTVGGKTTTTTSLSDVKLTESSGTSFGFYVHPALRLGWTF